MGSVTPLSFDLAMLAVRALLVAAHICLFIAVRRWLRRFGRAASTLAAAAVALGGLALATYSELFQWNVGLFGYADRDAGLWWILGGVWVAGSVGALLLYAAYRAATALRRGGSAASAPAGETLPRRQVLAMAGRVALAAPYAVAGYGAFIARRNFGLRETEMAVRNLPADLEGLRLVQLTDLHSGPHLSLRDVEYLVDMANETRPHVALVTGDLVTQQGDPLVGCLDRLSRLRSDAGTFGCLGNHEEYVFGSDFAEAYGRRVGLRFLRTRAELLRFGDAPLNLAGVDYQRQSEGYLEGAGSLVDPGAVNLLLSHNPDVFPRAAELGYDVTVSGHTHGGQITVEILDQTLNAGRFFTPYVLGKYAIGDAVLYVSPGLGTVNLPIRLGVPPEVTLLRLRRA